MKGSVTIAYNVFLNVLRKKILYVLLLFAAALIFALPVMPSFGVGVRVDLFRDLALGLTSLFAIVIGIAVGVNEIPAETDRRTIYNILSKPVRRSAFVTGKLLGLMLTLAVVVELMSLIAFGMTAVSFGVVDFGLFAASWAIFLEASVIAAFIVMVSTFATPPIAATLAAVFYFVGHVKGTLLEPALKNPSPAALPAKLLSYFLPGLEGLNVNGPVAHGLPVPPLRLGQMTLYAAAFMLAFLLIGAAAFERKDL